MITTRHAVKPEGKWFIIIWLTLPQTLKGIEGFNDKNTYDAVIHSMAVSDFTPESSVTLEDLEAVMAWQRKPVDLPKALVEVANERPEKNLFRYRSLVVVLKKTPKIISWLKIALLQTILVGFKLLVDVPMIEFSSLNVAKASLEKSKLILSWQMI